MKVTYYMSKKSVNNLCNKELRDLAEVGRRFMNCITEDDFNWLDSQAIDHHMDFFRYLGCLINAAHELYRDEHPHPYVDDSSIAADLSDDELPY